MSADVVFTQTPHVFGLVFRFFQIDFQDHFCLSIRMLVGHVGNDNGTWISGAF
jgi:hypothetical protein